MDPLLEIHAPATGVRTLGDPIRTLAEALEDVSQKVLRELNNPTTAPARRTQLHDRLALVRSVAGEFGLSLPSPHPG